MTQQYNALKHGMFTKATLLPFENKREYQRFRRNVVSSLCCENDLQTQRGYSIADSAWRLERLKKKISHQEKGIYDQLTPQMVCEFADVPEKFYVNAPEFLCDLQYKIKREHVDFAQQVFDQYEHCHTNFSTIPNLVAVFKQYPELFACTNRQIVSENKKSLINSATQTLDPVWQQNTKILWGYLEAVYRQAYFKCHWKIIQKRAAPWVEAWYFTKESHDHQLTRHKELQLKMQADFRKELSAYNQLKKNQWLFSKVLLELSGHSSPFAALPITHSSGNCAIEVKGIVANIALGTVTLPMGHAHSNSNLTANVSSSSMQH